MVLILGIWVSRWRFASRPAAFLAALRAARLQAHPMETRWWGTDRHLRTCPGFAGSFRPFPVCGMACALAGSGAPEGALVSAARL
jgi:hypothetical protein